MGKAQGLVYVIRVNECMLPLGWGAKRITI